MLGSLRNPFFRRISVIIGKSREKLCFNRTLLAGVPTTSVTTTCLSNCATDTFTSPYLSVRVHCRKDVADMLSEALLCFGASSASMDESDNCDETEEICVSSIFTECRDVGMCISHAANSIGLKEVPRYEVIIDEQCDWIKKMQESFHPVKVTEGLWIVPEWTSPPDVQETNIIINPGLAFGTGEHPTTKLCLLLLHGLVKGGELVLDYGTGSGILGIAALKLGASLSVGIDTDPQAITSARQNAALNNVGPQEMQLFLVPSTTAPMVGGKYANKETESPNGVDFIAEKEKYDIVIANILMNPLLELADQIVAYAKPGAIVGVSGILCEQLPQIKECYSQYLEGVLVSEMDGWACVSGTKRLNLRCN